MRSNYATLVEGYQGGSFSIYAAVRPPRKKCLLSKTEYTPNVYQLNGCSLSYQVNRDLYLGSLTHYENFDFKDDILFVTDVNQNHQGYTFTVHPSQLASQSNEIKGIIVNMVDMIPNTCGNLPSIKVNYEPQSSESCSLKEKENEDIQIPFDDQKPTKEGEDWKLQNNILSLSGNSMNYTGYTFTIIGYAGMPGLVVDMTELKANTCGNLPFVQINYLT